MKKIFCVLLCILMVAALAGCGEESIASNPATQPGTMEAPTTGLENPTMAPTVPEEENLLRMSDGALRLYQGVLANEQCPENFIEYPMLQVFGMEIVNFGGIASSYTYTLRSSDSESLMFLQIDHLDFGDCPQTAPNLDISMVSRDMSCLQSRDYQGGIERENILYQYEGGRLASITWVVQDTMFRLSGSLGSYLENAPGSIASGLASLDPEKFAAAVAQLEAQFDGDLENIPYMLSIPTENGPIAEDMLLGLSLAYIVEILGDEYIKVDYDTTVYRWKLVDGTYLYGVFVSNEPLSRPDPYSLRLRKLWIAEE